MCTVSIVAAGDRLRVVCNRDERHERVDAHPPAIVRAGAGLALMPRDPQGGGTWIAANTSGLVFALLNGPGAADPAGPSRGRIILDLLAAADSEQAAACARALCGRGWPPHRLLVIDTRQVTQLRLGRDGLDTRRFALNEPLMFTSSSLGDDLVEPPRRRLFQDVVLAAADRLDCQETFHRHRWQDRPHLSVHMRRHDAGTQSLTTVDVTPDAVAMRYEPVRDLVGTPGWLAIPHVRAAAVRSTAPSALALVS